MNISAPYDLDTFSNATNLYSTTVAANDIVGGIFAIFLLVSVFIITFVTMKNFETKAVFVTSSALTWLVSWLLYSPLQLINEVVLSTTSIILFISIIVLTFARD